MGKTNLIMRAWLFRRGEPFFSQIQAAADGGWGTQILPEPFAHIAANPHPNCFSYNAGTELELPADPGPTPEHRGRPERNFCPAPTRSAVSPFKPSSGPAGFGRFPGSGSEQLEIRKRAR